jgi:dienelactone hydrolase
MRGNALFLACIAAALVVVEPAARAQSGSAEFPPPQGKGRVVVVSSGLSGPEHYTQAAQAIAALGYDVLLVDGNAEAGSHGAGLRDAIEQAHAMPHALPGKVALVGFSLGGGMSLFYGSPLGDQVAGVVASRTCRALRRALPFRSSSSPAGEISFETVVAPLRTTVPCETRRKPRASPSI